MTTVAALYIDPKGPYPKMREANAFDTYDDDIPVGWITPREDGLTIDCWDASRDARLYDGPHPVVAHPPCRHWSRLRHLARVECACGWKGRESKLPRVPGIGPYCPECGADGPFTSDADCAPRAVEQVRRWGGVLEHPAESRLWKHCGLPMPTRSPVTFFVESMRGVCRYYSIPDSFGGYTIEVDQVEWGHVARKRTWLYLVGVPREALEDPPFPGREPTHHVSRDAERARRNGYTLKRTSKQQNERTPPLFAEYLIRLARAARP